MVQVCNALLMNVLPPASQDPALNYIYVKRLTDFTGLQQVQLVVKALQARHHIDVELRTREHSTRMRGILSTDCYVSRHARS